MESPTKKLFSFRKPMELLLTKFHWFELHNGLKLFINHPLHYLYFHSAIRINLSQRTNIYILD